MFSRQIVRAARASRVAAPVFKTTVPRAAFTTGVRAREPVPDVVAAPEVSSTTYTDGHVSQATIQVDQSTAQDSAAPLSKALYAQLPKTMKSMSLMDKVVVVTG